MTTEIKHVECLESPDGEHVWALDYKQAISDHTLRVTHWWGFFHCAYCMKKSARKLEPRDRPAKRV